MRLFFGLALPHGTRAAAAALSALAQERIAGRYVPAENYHVTLAFLGDTPPEDVPHAGEVLARCAAALPTPRLSPERPDVFGRMDNGILVLRLASTPDLAPLHDALLSALRASGLPATDGPFAPHITLARHAAASPQALLSLEREALRVPAFRPAHAHLYLSARDGAGILRYTPLLDAPFAPSLPSFDRGL